MDLGVAIPNLAEQFVSLANQAHLKPIFPPKISKMIQEQRRQIVPKMALKEITLKSWTEIGELYRRRLDLSSHSILEKHA